MNSLLTGAFYLREAAGYLWLKCYFVLTTKATGLGLTAKREDDGNSTTASVILAIFLPTFPCLFEITR